MSCGISGAAPGAAACAPGAAGAGAACAAGAAALGAAAAGFAGGLAGGFAAGVAGAGVVGAGVVGCCAIAAPINPAETIATASAVTAALRAVLGRAHPIAFVIRNLTSARPMAAVSRPKAHSEKAESGVRENRFVSPSRTTHQIQIIARARFFPDADGRSRRRHAH
jgi:hypothetical protein